MTRILFWNIENFSMNKINDPSTEEQPGASKKSRTEGSAQKLAFILEHLKPVTGVRPSPDIFIIVETCVGSSEKGVAINSTAATGVIELLEKIKDPTNNIQDAADWCLIPPIVCGCRGTTVDPSDPTNSKAHDYRESVSIFYNSKKLIFTGPWVWADDVVSGGQKSQPFSASIKPQNYPNPFFKPASSVLPSTTPTQAASSTVPLPAASPGVIPTRNIPQNQLAGQFEFVNIIDDSPLGFPGVGVDPSNAFSPPPANLSTLEKQYPGISTAFSTVPAVPMTKLGAPGTLKGLGFERSPFLVTFWDVSVPGGREIQLFAYHSSPDSAVAAVAKLGLMKELYSKPTYAQVRVIAADFNVDVCWGDRADFAYHFLKNFHRYNMHIKRPPANDPSTNTITDVQEGYVYTHQKAVKYAMPHSNKKEKKDAYPRFQYLDNNWDNIFTKHVNCKPPTTSNATIVNMVTGTPYDAAQTQAFFMKASGGTWTPPPEDPERYLDYPSKYPLPPPASPPSIPTVGPVKYSSYMTSVSVPVCPNDPSITWLIPTLPKCFFGNSKSFFSRNTQFQGWDHYGVIRGTSDHLAIVIDV